MKQTEQSAHDLSLCFPAEFIFFPSLLQILTQEDWNKVLYNGMASTSPVAALYFIALMTFGNYVLFNLLVAILVEGFQTEVGRQKVGPQKENYFLWILFY